MGNKITTKKGLKMLILFLKRLVILGLFIMFFFFACENKWQSPVDSIVNSGSDDDDSTPTRTRRRSSSSGGSSGGSSSSGSSSGGSSSGGSSDDGLGGHDGSTTGGTVGGSTDGGSSGGSSTGGTGGSTVYDGECPGASSVERYPSLTTITFQTYREGPNNERQCYNSKYRHPHFNFGFEHRPFSNCDCDCVCRYYNQASRRGGHGSADPNQNTLLRYTTDEGFADEQVIYLNGENIGRIHSENRYYIYYQKGSGSIEKTRIYIERLRRRGENYRWNSCPCNGNPSFKVIHTEKLSRYIVRGCQETPIKFWLATEDRQSSSISCRFHTP